MSKALAELLSHPALWRASRFQDMRACQQQTSDGIPTGHARLDRELPEGGWPRTSVIELLSSNAGQGELPLLAPALASLSQQSRWWVCVSPPWVPYAPALVQQGVRLERMLLVQPAQLRDSLWAMEQCLASGACAAVLGWIDKLQPQHIRRLQLAAQKGKSLGVLMRDARFAQVPSPAPVRVELGPCTAMANGHTQLNLRLLKRRGRWASDWLAIHWETPIAAAWSMTSVPVDNQTSTGFVRSVWPGVDALSRLPLGQS